MQKKIELNGKRTFDRNGQLTFARNEKLNVLAFQF